MANISKQLIFPVAVLLSLQMATASAQSMNVDSISMLSKAGVADGLIIDKINTEPCNYDVSVDGIIALKAKGVSENVIGAMIHRCATQNQIRGVAGTDESPDPTVKHSPGIYIYENWLPNVALHTLRPSKPSGQRTTGNGSVIFPLKIIVTLPGGSARVKISSTSPVFYFYFDVDDRRVSEFGTDNSFAAQSPSEFSLVKLAVKGDAREFTSGKMSAYGGFAMNIRKGVDPKAMVNFTASDVKDGIFKVSFDKPLAAGEYAFVFTGASGNSRIYDFSIG